MTQIKAIEATYRLDDYIQTIEANVFIQYLVGK